MAPWDFLSVVVYTLKLNEACILLKVISKSIFHNRHIIRLVHSNLLLYNLVTCGRSWRSGTKCDCKTDWLWVRSPLEEMKYLRKFISPFLRSGVEAKSGVEFCHSTCNATRIRQKVGNGVS